MLILALSAALLVLGILAARYGGWDVEFWGGLIAVLGGSVLVIGLVALPICHMDAHAKIAEIQAMRDTAAAARLTDDGIEGAAFRMKIAEANQWIARAKYYRTTAFAIWIPAEVESLEPIQ